MTKPEFVYTTYIKTTPEKLWKALINPEFTRQYWEKDMVSDWKKGSKWKMTDVPPEQTIRMVGEVLESVPNKRLVYSWADPAALKDDSRVTFEIEAVEDMVRLTVMHGDFKPGSEMITKISNGWPFVLSSLKSFLETGKGVDIRAFKSSCSTAA